MSFRLAAYAVSIEDGRVLLARHMPPTGESNWTLPGGRVEHGEDPFDAVIREVAEETGCVGVVDRLLGVDSRVIPAAGSRASECRRFLPRPHHRRPAPTGAERRNRRVGLDRPLRRPRAAPVIAG